MEILLLDPCSRQLVLLMVERCDHVLAVLRLRKRSKISEKELSEKRGAAEQCNVLCSESMEKGASTWLKGRKASYDGL